MFMLVQNGVVKCRERFSEWLQKKVDQSGEEKNFFYVLNGLQGLFDLIDDRKSVYRHLVYLTLFIASLNIVTPVIIKFVIDYFQVLYESNVLNPMLFVLTPVLVFVLYFRNYMHNSQFQRKLLPELIDFESYMPVRVHKKLLDLSLQFHTKNNTGSKMSKTNDGIAKLLSILMSMFWGILPQLLFIVVSSVIMFMISFWLGVICLIFLGYITRKILWISKEYADAWKRYRELKEQGDAVMTESIMHIRTVKSFNREAFELQRHQDVRTEMNEVDTKQAFGIQSEFYSLSNLLSTSYLMTGFAGGVLAYMKFVTLGTWVFVFMTSGQMVNSVWQIIHEYRNVMRNMSAVNRVAELLETQEVIPEVENPIILDSGIETIEFVDVWFRYSDNDPFILKDFNLRVDQKEMVAFVGHSGNGKSTILNLLNRFYDVTDGKILVNGVDIRELKLSWLRQQFAIVNQKVGIFEGTIAFNVRIGYPEATDEQVERALRAAQLHQVLENSERFSEGIGTIVGERGLELSGGEAQRVGIARAALALMYGEAQFLVLDEATASLDRPTEAEFQKAIELMRHNMSLSIIAIAHRIRTIQDSDVIHMVADGKVVESGNHGSLVIRNGAYAHFVADTSVQEAS